MKKVLKKTDWLTGDVSGLTGDVSGLTGDVSGVIGDATGITGNLDECDLFSHDRKNKIDIKTLISK